MLLLFTSVLQFFASQILPISSNASAAFSAQITLAPRAVIFLSNSSRYLSRCSIASHFLFFAFSRASITLPPNCCLPIGTTALYLAILKLILRLCSRSAALMVLLAIKDAAVSFMQFFLVNCITTIKLFLRRTFQLSILYSAKTLVSLRLCGEIQFTFTAESQRTRRFSQ